MQQKSISKTHRVTSFNELHEALSSMSPGLEGIGKVFRGQSNLEWNLIPKAGRGEYAKINLAVYFHEWKLHAAEFISPRPQSDWEWLAIAQHHGLATNLLDWTFNPLAAAYFAVFDNLDADAAIFAYSPDTLVLPWVVNPLRAKGIYVYRPFHVTQRITYQMGIFTAHDPPTLSLEEYDRESEKIELIIIDRSYRKQLLCDLATYGINQSTLFPGLDGLSWYINWKMLNSIPPTSL